MSAPSAAVAAGVNWTSGWPWGADKILLGTVVITSHSMVLGRPHFGQSSRQVFLDGVSPSFLLIDFMALPIHQGNVTERVEPVRF
jgi:hypothetical protein